MTPTSSSILRVCSLYLVSPFQEALREADFLELYTLMESRLNSGRITGEIVPQGPRSSRGESRT